MLRSLRLRAKPATSRPSCKIFLGVFGSAAFVVLFCMVTPAAVGQGGAGACAWDNSVGQSGMNGPVWSLATFDDGTGPALYAGGAFTAVAGKSANHIARWDGEAWTALGEGIGGVSSPIVYAMTVFDDGDGPALYAAGDFTTAGGETANQIARWDGTAWEALGEGLDNDVRALAVFDDGSGPVLYAGGLFHTAGTASATGIAKWDGGEWSALDSPLGGGLPFVYAFEVFDDGTGPALYAGGTMFTAGGKQAPNIARWDGSAWTSVGGGVSNWVSGLRAFDDALYAGGAFTTAGGVSALRVARWDGDSWSGMGAGTAGDFPWVNTLLPFDDGTGPALYVGGWFESAGGQPANRIARWDGETWSRLDVGLNERVWALLEHDDGSGSALYVAGHFTAAGGQPAGRIARWVCEPSVGTEGGATPQAPLQITVYPNPARGEATIVYETNEGGGTGIVVHDLLGRVVREVHADEVPPGNHTARFDVSDLAPGAYVVRITSHGESASAPLVVVR